MALMHGSCGNAHTMRNTEDAVSQKQEEGGREEYTEREERCPQLALHYAMPGRKALVCAPLVSSLFLSPLPLSPLSVSL
jgi:hypothetical protein